MIGKIWSVFFSFFFWSVIIYLFLLLLSKVDLIHQNEKMREFLKFTATQQTYIIVAVVGFFCCFPMKVLYKVTKDF